jgi:Holliday junction DNA helicase RuvA
MFYYIEGKLGHLELGTAVIDASGVGYKLTVSDNTYSAVQKKIVFGDAPTVRLYTYMAVREDGIELFGFENEMELSSFKLLISVSGVGPKAAMSILSLLTPEKFALAVCTEDKKTISKASGIGPKTAARIILELKDKLLKSVGDMDVSADTATELSTVSTNSGKLSEAQDALMVLGYTRSEAQNALKGIDTSALGLEDIIKAALKKLMKQ